MKAMEISINGRKQCVTGVGTRGVLATTVNWINTQNIAKSDCEFGIVAGGLKIDAKKRTSNIEWLNKQLRLGDEITIRLIETDRANNPKRKTRNN